MKRVLVICMLLLAFIIIPAYAFQPQEWARSSSEQTADALIYTGQGWFHQILITPDGTNDVTVSFYDNTSASGTEFLQTMTFAGTGGTQATPPVWIQVGTGIYIDVTTVGTVAYTVLYRAY